LINTAENPETTGRNDGYGHGVVDALAAGRYILANDSNEIDVEEPPNSNPECVPIEVTLQTDQFARDTSHSLRAADGTVLWSRSGFRNFQSYSEEACVDPRSCYRFTVRDSYGDGLLGNGLLVLSYNGEVQYSGANFGSGGIRDLGDGCA